MVRAGVVYNLFCLATENGLLTQLAVHRLKTFSKARQCILPLKALFASVTLLVLANDFSATRFLAILDSRALLNVFSLRCTYPIKLMRINC